MLYDAKRHTHTAQGVAVSAIHGDLLWCDGGWPGSCHEHELLTILGIDQVLDDTEVTTLVDRGYGASCQIGSTVASGGCDAVHDHAGRQPGSDLRKEAALCLPRGADAGASTTGTTRRCSRSLGFPGPPRPRSAIRDRLSGFVMGR